jgi:hypothetical protein
MLGGWVVQYSALFGYGGMQAYLPKEDLAIATALAPSHPPQP